MEQKAMSPSKVRASAAPSEGPAEKSTGDVDFIDQVLAMAPKSISQDANGDSSGSAAGAAMPPAMASVKQYSADEVITMLNRMPLFMTDLDETDGEGGENVELEAIKALLYEGTRADIAENFKEQGNELARVKKWAEAKGFYDKALATLRTAASPEQVVEEEKKADEEAGRRRQVEELSYVNRALCNLELKNYRSCNLDCAQVLRINPSNVKAWYRSAGACLLLDKIDAAEDACQRGLLVDEQNAPLKALNTKIAARKAHLQELERKRIERLEREQREAAALKKALKTRNIPSRETAAAPSLEDATMKLEDPSDPDSTLSIPVVIVYPVHLQTDFIKSFSEVESINDHLEYLLPLPWDEQSEYQTKDVECFIESAAGGLIKAGKKLPLSKILGSGKIEIVDGMLKINVLPKARTTDWIEEFKARNLKR